MGYNGILVGALVLAYLAFLRSAAEKRARKSDGKLWLEHSWTMKSLGLVGLATMVYAVVINLVRGEPIVALICGTMFLSLSIYPVMYGFFWKVGYDTSGLYCYSPWRGHRFVPWSSVTAIRSFRFMDRQWSLVVDDKALITVNDLMRGASEFLDELKRRGFVAVRSDWSVNLVRWLLSLF